MDEPDKTLDRSLMFPIQGAEEAVNLWVETHFL